MSMTFETVLSVLSPSAFAGASLLSAVLLLIVVLLISPIRGAAVEPAR